MQRRPQKTTKVKKVARSCREKWQKVAQFEKCKKHTNCESIDKLEYLYAKKARLEKHLHSKYVKIFKEVKVVISEFFESVE